MRKPYQDVVMIAAGMILAKILTSNLVYCLPVHAVRQFRIFVQRTIELRRNAAFYNDSIIPNAKNVLFLCHGRNHGYPIIRDETGKAILKVNECNFYTVDINHAAWPHYHINVIDVKLSDEILKDATASFDYIVLFNCTCHTHDINNDLTVASKIRSLLKDDGVLFVKDQRMKLLLGAGFRKTSINYTVDFPSLKQYKSYARTLND